MQKKIIASPVVGARVGGFVPAISVQGGRMLLTSGILARDASGAMVAPGEVGPQTRQCFVNLQQLLAQAGAALDDIVKMTVYLATDDMAQYQAMGAVRAEFMGEACFCSTAVKAGFFAPGAVVEIEVLAVVAE